MLCHVRLSYVMLLCAMLCYNVLRCVELCRVSCVVMCYVMLCCVQLCSVITACAVALTKTVPGMSWTSWQELVTYCYGILTYLMLCHVM